jgi:hypothetical protein
MSLRRRGSYNCILCESIKRKKRYKEKKEECRSYGRLWRKNNIQKTRDAAIKYYQENKIRCAQRTQKGKVIGRKNLQRWYVLQGLTKSTLLVNKDIPDELVAAKQIHLKLYRLIKEKSND